MAKASSFLMRAIVSGLESTTGVATDTTGRRRFTAITATTLTTSTSVAAIISATTATVTAVAVCALSVIKRKGESGNRKG